MASSAAASPPNAPLVMQMSSSSYGRPSRARSMRATSARDSGSLFL